MTKINQPKKSVTNNDIIQAINGIRSALNIFQRYLEDKSFPDLPTDGEIQELFPVPAPIQETTGMEIVASRRPRRYDSEYGLVYLNGLLCMDTEEKQVEIVDDDADLTSISENDVSQVGKEAIHHMRVREVSDALFERREFRNLLIGSVLSNYDLSGLSDKADEKMHSELDEIITRERLKNDENSSPNKIKECLHTFITDNMKLPVLRKLSTTREDVGVPLDTLVDQRLFGDLEAYSENSDVDLNTEAGEKLFWGTQVDINKGE
jgi:hypothetical protein